MQPDGPYRFTEVSGSCQVGRAWWAIDGQDRLATVAVLDGPAATDHGWRTAFRNAANTLAQTPGGHPYVDADFAAAQPWVAYSSEEDGAAPELFRILGMELRPEAESSSVAAEAVLEPAPEIRALSPATGHPVSGAPPLWAALPPVSGAPISGVPVSLGAPTATAATGLEDPFTSPQRRIQPSSEDSPGGRPWVAVCLLVLLVVAVSGGLVVWTAGADGRTGSATAGTPMAFPPESTAAAALKPWTQFSPSSVEERAVATAAPSLVFIEAVITGYLRNSATNAPLAPVAVSITRRCSGFIVSSEGSVLTSSSCVRPAEEEARESALTTLAKDMTKDRTLASGQVDGYVKAKLASVRFTGADPGSAPTSQVYGQLNTARSNLTAAPAIPGQVVAALPADQGGMALVKLFQENLPAVELNTSNVLKAGVSLLVVGFRSSDSDDHGTSYTPRARKVTVTGVSQFGPVPVYRVSGDASRISYGGVALDPGGRVVGMLDQDRDEGRPDSANDIVVPAVTGAALLDKAGVGNALGDADQRYRDGLAAYFSGNQDAAVSALDQAVKGSPGNLLAQAYRENAVQRHKLEGGSVARPAWLNVSVGGLGGALIASLLIWLVAVLRRRRQV